MPVRPAATVIVVRDGASVLVGQRGAKAAFMPSKFVFPGGAVDVGDSAVPLAAPLGLPCADRIAEGADPDLAAALPAAAIRELWEETGLRLAVAGEWQAQKGWRGFARGGHRPTAAPLRFVFRAITPPGRPRRFDARFFAMDAADLVGDPDDFSGAEDELSHLQWVPLERARSFDLPFITEVVLAEIIAQVGNPGPPRQVPFFYNDDEETLFRRIGSPLDQPLDG